MNKNLMIKTGNRIVDEMSKINFSGNVIPETWYHTIVGENGKPYCLAIMILADICYWYRPTEVRDEDSTEVKYVKKFRAQDFLQRSYEQIAEHFNISKKQARDAVVVLEKLGLIRRIFRDVNSEKGKLNNVMFIELIPSAVTRYTYPDDAQGGAIFHKEIVAESELGNAKDISVTDQKNIPSLQICREPLSTNLYTPAYEFVETNTENTTEITLNNKSTTEESHLDQFDDKVVDDSVKKIFEGLGLTGKDILRIVTAAKGNLERCREVVSLLKEQPGEIRSVVGWLIRAITDDYKKLPGKFGVQKQYQKEHVKNSFFDFKSRDMSETDWRALEKKIFVN